MGDFDQDLVGVKFWQGDFGAFDVSFDGSISEDSSWCHLEMSHGGGGLDSIVDECNLIERADQDPIVSMYRGASFITAKLDLYVDRTVNVFYLGLVIEKLNIKQVSKAGIGLCRIGGCRLTL